MGTSITLKKEIVKPEFRKDYSGLRKERMVDGWPLENPFIQAILLRMVWERSRISRMGGYYPSGLRKERMVWGTSRISRMGGFIRPFRQSCSEWVNCIERARPFAYSQDIAIFRNCGTI